MYRKVIFLLVFGSCLIIPMLNGQGPYNPYKPFHYRLCYWEILEPFVIEEFFPPVPVGCEIIDCCPGCPGDEIDWRIRVTGDPIEEAFLEFRNLDPTISKGTRITGNGSWIESNILTFGPGEIVLQGLRMNKIGKVPLAYPKIKIKKEFLEGTKFSADNSPLTSNTDFQIKLDIEALKGDYLVYEYSVIIFIDWCHRPDPVKPMDIIDLNNNAGNDNAVILFDGRYANGCADNTIFRTSDRIGIGNALPKQNCNSEVIVFSDDDAMQIIVDHPWTSLSNVLTVDMTPDILTAPVSVWLLTNPNNTVMARAQNEIAQASLLYNTNNCGIAFNATIQDASTNNTAVNLVGTNTGGMCANNWITNLTGSAFYSANRLNVYYVNGAFTGLTCIAEPNIIVIGTTAQVETLAHEFGHSFTLDHTNTTAGIPAFNLMVGGGANRTNITEGQAFRCNVNPASVLNTNGVRNGITRTCSETANTNLCLPITFNVNNK